ncbi:MAG: hypothetical protein KKG09_03040 [Verrucomicrobia bacterium]|nr:hypothetical protein [Verrucomicrobiota bacterium]MCG2681942.1 hypothetical protein [Kiritimatiellia bacterium]MBU4247142.1 hypothetical protein [Verrucomicrobiota bacterium]MBU4290983.1 hypothetical protein [Verrucomicrobiota bacterium]MBU4430422.1 hypothetical protein [Verrucomicrobiota bacterium]
MSNQFLVGAAEVDITPPVGTALAGSLKPRTSIGVDDPLTFKAVVLESGGVKLAYVLADLIVLGREIGDEAVALTSSRTGIPPTNILWAASHTHTGPYTMPLFGGEINQEWLDGLPEKFAQAVAAAHKSRRPARMIRKRGYCLKMIHNRRLKFKDGREINTWLLHRGEEEIQCLGAAAPVDPEVGILCFDDEQGVPIAILWHFSLHTNANFGPRFSADYPGVVAGRLRERFGAGVVPIFMPGAEADINPLASYCQVGDELASVIIQNLDKRQPGKGGIKLGALKAEVVVPWRDLTVDQEKRIKDSQWLPTDQAVFRKELELMRKAGVRESRTVIQAWRIGEIGFASLPGELFIEWGLKIKAESPFPWTFPVELGADYLGYLVTEQAWRAGGYESLIARSARPSVEGVAKMVDTALDLLGRLWKT